MHIPPNWGTFFALIVSFLVFWFIFSRLFFRPFLNLLSERERRFKDLNDRTEQLIKAGARGRSGTRRAARRGRKGAFARREAERRKAEAEAAQMMEAAKAEARETLEQVRAKIETELKAAERELEQMGHSLAKRAGRARAGPAIERRRDSDRQKQLGATDSTSDEEVDHIGGDFRCRFFCYAASRPRGRGRRRGARLMDAADVLRDQLRAVRVGAGYFAGPVARKFFADRAATIRTALSRAQSALAEAEDLANKAAARMAALSAELKKLGDELEQETAFQVGKVAELAKSTAERIRRDTEMSSSALSEAAKRRVRAQLAESAATLARDHDQPQFSAERPGPADRRLHGQARHG